MSVILQFIPIDTIHYWIKIIIHLTIVKRIFLILIENKSEHETVHLNKGQKIGYITTDCCVDENLPSSTSQQINLIQTSVEILSLRKNNSNKLILNF